MWLHNHIWMHLKYSCGRRHTQKKYVLRMTNKKETKRHVQMVSVYIYSQIKFSSKKNLIAFFCLKRNNEICKKMKLSTKKVSEKCKKEEINDCAGLSACVSVWKKIILKWLSIVWYYMMLLLPDDRPDCESYIVDSLMPHFILPPPFYTSLLVSSSLQFETYSRSWFTILIENSPCATLRILHTYMKL